MDAPETEVEDAAITLLRENIDAWLVALQFEGVQPVVAAGQLFDVLVQVLEPNMGRGAIRTALLMTFEKSFPKPMTFIERGDASRLITQISNVRRQVEGKPHLVLPGEFN